MLTVGGLLAALVVVSAVAASNPPSPSSGQSRTDEPRASSQPDKGRTPIANTEISAAGNIQRVQNATGNQSQHEKAHEPTAEWWTRPDCWLVALTAMLAFVTWRLVVQTRSLVAETMNTSARQADETIKAIGIAQQSANAATKAAEVAERALNDLERPWIFINIYPGIFERDQRHSSRYITWEVSNHGRTPAILDIVVAGDNAGIV